MKAVIFVVHGSQIRQKNKELARLIKQVSEILDDYADLYHIAYLERQSDTIEIITKRAVKAGAQELIIVPVLLFPALHALVDIPTQVREALGESPEVKTKFLKTFAEELPIFEILLDRIKEIDNNYPDAEIILLAHGTRHFAEAESGLSRVAERLSRQTAKIVQPVDYLGKKTYQSVIRENIQHSISQVVLPFFIYDGVLVEKIYHSIQTLSPMSKIPFTETLALDARIVSALVNVIPILLNLHRKKIVVVGGGKVATRKVQRLVEETQVVVVAKEATIALKMLASSNQIELKLKSYEKADIFEADLIYICTNNQAVNQQIVADARPNQWLNDTTEQRNSDFFSMSEFQKNELTIALTTAGKNPRQIKLMKQQLQNFFE